MRFSVLPWLFLITTTTVVSIFFCISVESQCLEHQKSLLLQLKDNLIFNSSLSTKLVLWNHNTDCCEWAGVTCDDDDMGYGYVVGLDLSDESISGEIPIGISHLTRLVSLDLSWNNDLELGNSNLKLLVQNLTELTELRLDYVNISSKGKEWCEAISSSLPNLRLLSLRDCDLSGTLCSSLENLRSLSLIDLSWNNFSAPLPNFFAKFTNLTKLYLIHSNLQGTFPKNIFHIPTLRSLHLGDNELLEGSFPEFSQNGSLHTLILRNTKFSGRLPDSIGNLRTLSTIDVRDCNFTGSIPSSMANLTQLVDLDLSYNMFIGPVPSLPKNLSIINLSSNKLTGTLPSTHFEGLSNLVEIDLSYNSVSGSIPSSLFELPSLKRIDLLFNQFDGQVDEFSNASSSLLQVIDLSSNNLQGSVPMSFFKLGRLTFLSINSNNFSGSVQLEKFYRLSNLSILDLSYNSLSIHITSGSSSSLSFIPQFGGLFLASCNLQSFPQLKNQSRLASLDLSNNQIEGEIPNWIWNGELLHLNLSHNLISDFQEPYVIHFTTLQFFFTVLDLHSNQLHGEIPIPRGSVHYLDLSSNSFISSIPPTIGNVLTGAHFFSLSNNRIIGNIPRSICKMGYLEVLDLSNNRLNGTIPSCLIQRSTSTLGVLNLRNNRFSGNILSIFPKNCSLQTLDLNNNHLEGRVPKSLSNCRGMEVLNLGNNMISDRFPCFLENISSLHVLVLRSNRFQGDINCQGGNNESWWKLQIIDLAINNFGGALSPSFFSNWKAMMTHQDNAQPKLNNLGYQSQIYSSFYSNRVDVIYKGIEVELVKVLTIFTAIDFSSNRFEGKVPDTVGNLKSLVLLNLSHNAFKDSIPTSLGNLNELESLDLSQNMLTEMIPTQLASLTFLSVLNVSYNLLVGRIPTGSQFQTFSETSFLGNPGLCGFPLNVSCKNADVARDSPPIFKDGQSILEPEVYLSAALGFIVGLGIIIWPLVFSRRWRQWYYKHMDRVFLRRIIQKGAYRNPIQRL